MWSLSVSMNGECESPECVCGSLFCLGLCGRFYRKYIDIYNIDHHMTIICNLNVCMNVSMLVFLDVLMSIKGGLCETFL